MQALAVALASFGYLYLRRLYTLNPDSVYRLAMLQLNTNPGVLEVTALHPAHESRSHCLAREPSSKLL